MHTPYWPRAPLRISLLPPLWTQNTDAGFASAQARSGPMASMTRKMKPIDRRIFFSRFACNRTTRCEASTSVYIAEKDVSILCNEMFMLKRPATVVVLLAGLMLLLSPEPGPTEDYPSRPLRLIIPT